MKKDEKCIVLIKFEGGSKLARLTLLDKMRALLYSDGYIFKVDECSDHISVEASLGLSYKG